MLRYTLGCFFTIVAMVPAAWTTPADVHPETLRIAILPCNNIEITFSKFHPILQYLEKDAGIKTRLVVPSSLDDFAASLKSGQIDFALQDPHTFAELSRFFNTAELLRTLTIDGRPTQSGVVVVRGDSQVRKLEELRGKTVMFGPTASTPKWTAARILFEEHGMDIDRDLKSYRNGGCCEDIAFAVYMKSAEAGVVCEHFLADHEDKQKDLGLAASNLRVIARTPAFPCRLFAARKDLAPDIVSRVNNALLRLDAKSPDHARILFRAELGGFLTARRSDYTGLRVPSRKPSLR
jgi:phosphonate transport system substrate-binding protein